MVVSQDHGQHRAWLLQLTGCTWPLHSTSPVLKSEFGHTNDSHGSLHLRLIWEKETERTQKGVHAFVCLSTYPPVPEPCQLKTNGTLHFWAFFDRWLGFLLKMKMSHKSNRVFVFYFSNKNWKMWPSWGLWIEKRLVSWEVPALPTGNVATFFTLLVWPNLKGEWLQGMVSQHLYPTHRESMASLSYPTRRGCSMLANWCQLSTTGAIREEVASIEKMPPWYTTAGKPVGYFLN